MERQTNVVFQKNGLVVLKQIAQPIMDLGQSSAASSPRRNPSACTKLFDLCQKFSAS
jgi:hypothetical protein